MSRLRKVDRVAGSESRMAVSEATLAGAEGALVGREGALAAAEVWVAAMAESAEVWLATEAKGAADGLADEGGNMESSPTISVTAVAASKYAFMQDWAVQANAGKGLRKDKTQSVSLSGFATCCRHAWTAGSRTEGERAGATREGAEGTGRGSRLCASCHGRRGGSPASCRRGAAPIKVSAVKGLSLLPMLGSQVARGRGLPGVDTPLPVPRRPRDPGLLRRRGRPAGGLD
jgi:hypothetical protein